MGGRNKGEEKEGEFVHCVPLTFFFFFSLGFVLERRHPIRQDEIVSQDVFSILDVNFSCLLFDDLVFNTTSTPD